MFGVAVVGVGIRGGVGGGSAIGVSVWIIFMGMICAYRLIKGFWFRLTVTESTVRLRNAKTIELQRDQVARVITEYPLPGHRILGGPPRNSVFLELHSGRKYEISLMQREWGAWEWTDLLYEDRLRKIAGAIGCVFEPAEG